MAKQSKRKRFSVFWCCYLLFVASLVVFWLCIVSYVKKSLLVYEENQPDKKMEQIMSVLRETGLEEYLTVNEKISRFETAENYEKAFHSRMDGRILFWTRARGVQSATAPKYDLYADGDPVGTITLREASSEPLMVILTLSRWELDRVDITPAEAQESVEVTVPDSYRVMINGQQADERELAGGGEMPEEFKYAANYVEVPKLVTYRAEGLLERPQVAVFDRNGVEADCVEEYINDRLEVRVSQFAETEMPKELSDMALENAKRYSNFFSADLPGCRNSVDPVRDMFPADSDYLEFLDIYRREDMWMYSAHSTPEFKNESADHYIRYSEDLFSCEVYFDKHMYLTRTQNTKVDTTHFRLFYGLLDGKWKILDIQTLLEDR